MTYPAVRLFGPLGLKGTCCPGANGGAVKKRLLRRAGPAVAIFGLVMAVADIGPTILWIAAVKVALALGIFAERWRSPAGRRRHARPRHPRRLAASPDALSRCGWSVRRTHPGLLSASIVSIAGGEPLLRRRRCG